MEVQINWMAVILATLSSMVVGSVWYAPPVFGNMWMKLIGKKRSELPQSWTPLFLAVLSSAVTAFVLAHFTYLAYEFYKGDYSFMTAALLTSIWAWLGFTAMRFLTHDGFEGRSYKLTLVNVMHELATLVAMGLIIGLLKP